MKLGFLGSKQAKIDLFHYRMSDIYVTDYKTSAIDSFRDDVVYQSIVPANVMPM